MTTIDPAACLHGYAGDRPCDRCAPTPTTIDPTAEGLRSKYHVERRADPDGKHIDCRYFVLDPQHDPIARDALLRYMTVAREQGYTALADDLWAWIEATEPHYVMEVKPDGRLTVEYSEREA